MKTRDDPTRDCLNNVRETWEVASVGWRKWEPMFGHSSWPITQVMMQQLSPHDGMRVLDVGCGIGDPSLAIAKAVDPGGSVLGIDLSDRMIETAKDRASALSIANAEYRTISLDEMGENQRPFDAVTGRFSIMFFPNIDAGLRNMLRLIKPGGRVVLSTWTPQRSNPMFDIPASALSSVVQSPPPDPDAPGPMRLAEAGQVESALATAGFERIESEEVDMYFFAPSVDMYWTLVTEMSGSFQTVLKGLSDGDVSRIRQLVCQAVANYEKHGVVRVPARARVTTGWRS
jgi:enediyne biosynthesis protein CalE5